MSINHYSPESPWWPHHHLQPIAAEPHSNSFARPQTAPLHHRRFLPPPPDFQEENQDVIAEIQLLGREPMFEKPLTPSDVGKLNRLVIPKHHAEKYFPIGNGGEKGSLLSFEDECGKFWKFRYSYWNSSQSYVLTKGWSRYVKEKRLDAGDVVLFERDRGDVERQFIRWRRNGYGAAPAAGNLNENSLCGSGSSGGACGGGGGWTRVVYLPHSYPARPLPCQPADSIHAGGVGQSGMTQAEAGNQKRLRLFGVNLECQLDETEPSIPDDGCSRGPPTPAHARCRPPYLQPLYHHYTGQGEMNLEQGANMRSWPG